jgi:hypothetical protein
MRRGRPIQPRVVRVGSFPESRLPVEGASYESELSRRCPVFTFAFLDQRIHADGVLIRFLGGLLGADSSGVGSF